MRFLFRRFFFVVVVALKCVLHISIFNFLERKLQKLQKDASVLEQLKARREHCMENLLQGNITLHDSQSEDLQRLEEEFVESRTRDIARYLVPEQAVNNSELLHIINHDHLEVNTEPSTKPADDTQGDFPSQ